MSLKCGKCETVFQAAETIAKCTDCKESFHPACTHLGTVKNFTKAKKIMWKCDSCKDENASTVNCDEISEDRPIILAALASMKSELINCIDSKIGNVQCAIDSMTEEFKTLNNKYVVLEKIQQELNVRCNVLEGVTESSKSEVRELKQRVLDLEQHSRCHNIEIQGLPSTPKEDIYFLIMKISEKLGLPCPRNDISIAHRLRLYSNKHSYPPTIVQFVSRSVREQWLTAARKRKGLNASEVSTYMPSGPVYINEHLTANNKALLGHARRLLREKKIHFAAYNNGKILVKGKEGDDTQRVLFKEDLDKYDS